MSNCKHKFGEIKEGYQYCKICNKAEPVECSHVYKIINDHHFRTGIIFTSVDITYVSQCIYCGDIKTTVV